MKKLSIIASILAVGTMCITGCNMGKPNNKTAPETLSIAVQDEGGEKTPAPSPDDCRNDGNCHRGKMPYKKPGFRFKVPHGKHGEKTREKFRRYRKRPAPKPENPEAPATPEDEENN